MSHIHDKSDDRNIKIDNVGIYNYKLPMVFRSENDYSVISDIIAGVTLDANLKGAHLSRIIEVLDEMVANKLITMKRFDEVLFEMSRRLELDNANLTLSFPIVYPNITPVSKRITYLNSEIVVHGKINNCRIEKNMSLSSNGTMLCPNSKSISKYGAHSQKCNLKATLFGNINDISVEKVLRIISSQFSAEVYGIVKSVDEKLLTEKAYDNPKFSEDLVRDTLIALKEYYNNGVISVQIENLESIHQHNVYARGLIK